MNPPTIEPLTHPLRDRVLTAGPDLLIAVVYLLTWISPRVFGDDTVQNLIFIVVFEFVILHSASALVAILIGRLGDGKGTGCLLAVSLFYLLFAVGFAFVIKAWWPVLAILGLTYNRVQTLWQQPREGRRARLHVIATWGLTFGFYVALFIVVHLIPWPPLGIDAVLVEDLLAQGSGSLLEKPQIALVFGLIYYGGIGLAEWLDFFNKATDRITALFSGWRYGA